MADEPKILDGEVVEETVTGRLVKRDAALSFHEVPGVSPGEFQFTEDLAEIERRIAARHGFIGVLFDAAEAEAKAEALKPENRLVILTDDDE